MKSAELNPLDATTQYILGKWCFNIAAIDFVTRTAASLFFATPPTSSYEEALGYFMKSEELNPNNIRNRLMIGDTYTAMGQTDKAKEWYKKASETPTTGETEKALLEEAKTKMNQKSGWFY
jgi:tetratricopeptide (TPR) repeat protein